MPALYEDSSVYIKTKQNRIKCECMATDPVDALILEYPQIRAAYFDAERELHLGHIQADVLQDAGQRCEDCREELKSLLSPLSMTELLERFLLHLRGDGSDDSERLEHAYEAAAQGRLKGLFRDLRHFWEPAARNGHFGQYQHLDFQRIIDDLTQWYAFYMEHRELNGDYPLSEFADYILRFEALRDVVRAEEMELAHAFRMASHPRLHGSGVLAHLLPAHVVD